MTRFPELGQVRHVEANLPSPKAIVTAVVTVLVFCAAVVAGNGELADVPPLAAAWAALAALILWLTGSEKVVVCERGMLLSSFAPFLVPRVIPFRDFSALSVTATRPAFRVDRMVGGTVRMFVGRTAPWAWNGVAFVARPGAYARRPAVDAKGVFDPAVSSVVGVWWFGTWHEPDRLVHALEAALTAYGDPQAPGMSGRALPKVRLSGRPEDAAVQVPRLLAAASPRQVSEPTG